MKWIKYRKGASDMLISYSEKNLAIVMNEADNGEYTIEDDGEAEPVAAPTAEERLEALEAAMLEMMGVAVDG